MLRELLKDSIIYSSATILSRSVNLLLLPLYTSVLLPSDYGTIDIVQVCIAISMILITCEITQSIARLYPEIETPRIKREYSSTAFWFITVNSILAVTILYFSRNIIAQKLFHDNCKVDLITLGIVSLVSQIYYYFFQLQLRWDFKAIHYSLTSIIQVFIQLILTIVFVLHLSLGIKGVFYGQICGNLIGIYFSWSFNKSSYGFTFTFKILKKLLQFSYPLIVSSIIVACYYNIDRIMLQKLMDLTNVGIYGVAVRLASIVSLLLFGFNSALTPLIYKYYSEKQTQKKISLLFSLFTSGSMAMIALVTLFSKEIIKLVASPTYSKASEILPFLLIGSYFTNAILFVPGLSISKKSWIISLLSIVTIGVSIGLNILLIPLFGLLGVGYANMFSGIINFTFTSILGNSYYHIEIRNKMYILLMIVIIALFYTWTQTSLISINPPKLFIKVSLSLILLFFFFRIIKLQYLEYKKQLKAT